MDVERISKGVKLFCGYALIVTCIYLFLQIKSCIDDHHTPKQIINNKQPKLLSSDTTTQYVYVDRWNTITFTPAAKEIIIHDSILVQIVGPIDTLAVIKHFYQVNNYIDTLQDSSLIAVLRIKIEENKLLGHPILDYKITAPQIIKTITNTVEEKPKGYFLAGVRGGTNKMLYTTFGPEVIFVSKKKKGYGVGYDIIHQSVNASFYYPLTR